MKLPNSARLYLALVFVSGILVGGVAVQLYTAYGVSAKTAPLSPDEARRRYAEEMRARLKLNPDQFRSLNTILEETHQNFRHLREKWRPEVKAIQDQQADRIRGILDDRQRQEFEKFREEREKRRQQSCLQKDRRRLGA